MSNGIGQLIFETILRIDPSLLIKYTAMQDQILYLILIPHIILFIFIFGFMRVIGGEHKGLQYLVGIGAYLFIIIGGWYGDPLVGLFILWWQVLLVVAIVFFIGSKFIHPARIREIFNIGKSITGKVTEKPRLAKKLEKQIRSIDRQIEAINSRYRGTTMPRLAQREIDELVRRKAEVQAELEEL
jgi:hypothetical protein